MYNPAPMLPTREELISVRRSEARALLKEAHQLQRNTTATAHLLSSALRSSREGKVSRDTKRSAPSQACSCQTARSVFCEQVNQVGTSWGKALAHPVYQFHG